MNWNPVCTKEKFLTTKVIALGMRCFWSMWTTFWWCHHQRKLRSPSQLRLGVSFQPRSLARFCRQIKRGESWLSSEESWWDILEKRQWWCQWIHNTWNLRSRTLELRKELRQCQTLLRCWKSKMRFRRSHWAQKDINVFERLLESWSGLDKLGLIWNCGCLWWERSRQHLRSPLKRLWRPFCDICFGIGTQSWRFLHRNIIKLSWKNINRW